METAAIRHARDNRGLRSYLKSCGRQHTLARANERLANVTDDRTEQELLRAKADQLWLDLQARLRTAKQAMEVD